MRVSGRWYHALQDETALGQLDPSASHPIRDAERLALLLERGDGGAHGSAVFRLLAGDDYDAPNSKTIAAQALRTDAILMTSGAIDSHVAP